MLAGYIGDCKIMIVFNVSIRKLTLLIHILSQITLVSIRSYNRAKLIQFLFYTLAKYAHNFFQSINDSCLGDITHQLSIHKLDAYWHIQDKWKPFIPDFYWHVEERAPVVGEFIFELYRIMYFLIIT